MRVHATPELLLDIIKWDGPEALFEQVTADAIDGSLLGIAELLYVREGIKHAEQLYPFRDRLPSYDSFVRALKRQNERECHKNGLALEQL
ncbi:hypothetical protein UFOVP75_207 [uncultured Caudovirales phage]|uniref:Uncharacterized protein n=1 Tax=uncultured Caudovirales phage TaxID=2100421 RepID=A0A6J5L6D4_9CAUD|nr:hypothetical protein UFOVP75_207 [uncultured Caudovirales phage]